MSETRSKAPARPSPGPSSLPGIINKDGEGMNTPAPGDASTPSSRKPTRRVTIESPPRSRSSSGAGFGYYGNGPRFPSPESPGSNDATVGRPPAWAYVDGQQYTETPQKYPQGLVPSPQTYLTRSLGYQPSPDFDPIIWADIYGATNNRDAHAPTPQSVAGHLPGRPVPPPPGPPYPTEYHAYDGGRPHVSPFSAPPPQAAYGGSIPIQPYGPTLTPLAQPPPLLLPSSQVQGQPYSSAYHVTPPVSLPYIGQAAPSVFQHEIPGVFSAYAPHSFPVQLPLAATEQNWPELLQHCQTSDEALIQKWDDEINALLVYAGLFSAVVTAFVIESYQLLQPDMGDQTVAGLTSVSRQLEILITGGGPTSQSTAFTRSNNVASTSAVALNALWLLSLIAALISASSAILLKQTFREYKTWSNVPRPLEALRLRQLRFHAFRTWRVSDIVASLPATLEVAVLLFMAGLPLFVWNLNVTLSVIITAVAGCFLVTTLVVTILPALNFDFPYKSPVAWALWKARVYTTGVFRYRFGSNKSGLPTTQADNNEKKYPEFSSTSSSASWQERDLRFSKAKELQHLWDLLRWFCSSWSDHRLHSAVRACMSDLIYRSNALNTAYHNYIDVIETALPTILDMSPTQLYPALLQANQLPQELISQLFPFALVDASSVEKLNAKLAQLPWKMLALLFDEVVAGLRVAVRDDFNSSMYDQDKNKALAVASLCFLECLMERVKTEQLQPAFDESRIALICDISCHIMASVLPSSSLNMSREEDAYASSAPKIRSLEDIVLSWIGSRNDLVISRDNCLRMLFAADVRKSAILDARGGIPKANDMRLFATLTSLALNTITGNAYLEDPIVADAYNNAISSIESVVRLSYEKSISNCGMGATEFPWTMILSNSARSLSDECRDDLAKGFRSGLFTCRDPAEQIALLQALMTSSGRDGSGRSKSHEAHPSMSRSRKHSFGAYHSPFNPQLTPVTEQAQSTSSSTLPQQPGLVYPPSSFLPRTPFLPPNPFPPLNPLLSPGFWPQSSHYPSPDGATGVPNSESDDMIMLARAHSAFAGFSGSNELHLRPDDVIEVLDRTYDWWWTGRLRDRIGLFPVDYVTMSLTSKHSRSDMRGQVEPVIPTLSTEGATLSRLTEYGPAALPVIEDHASNGSIGKQSHQVGSEESLLMRQASSSDSPTAFNADDETNTVTQDRPASMTDGPKETADMDGVSMNDTDLEHQVQP